MLVQGNGKYDCKSFYKEDVVEDYPGLKIAPMQAFILHNAAEEEEVSTLSYKNMVYNPAMGGGSGAPRRAKVADYTAKMRIVVDSEDGSQDIVVMRERQSDNRSAVKYVNDDVNIYAHGIDNNLSNVFAGNIEDTYFGFSTVNGGKFTIRFANVIGREFDFIDLETGARVAAEEGKTYTFTADANTTADYRFKLVARKKVATDVDAIGAEKNAKGIYTIMGQYVGEMNLWNTLPAGVYVVNGEKRVK